MIDLTTIQAAIEMNERKKYLEMHNYKVWQSPDGKWHTYFQDENKCRVRRDRKTKKDIEDLIVSYYRKKEEVFTIKSVFDEWNDRRLEIGKISAATHLRITQIYERHYKEFGLQDIQKVYPDDFSEFLEAEVLKKKLTTKAYGNLKSLTRGMMKRAKRRKLIDWNVEDMLESVDLSERDFKYVVKDDVQEVFNEEELPLMLDYCMDNIDIETLAILLAFSTGCRVGEIVALKFEDFMYDNTAFIVKRTQTRYKLKGDKNYSYSIKEFPKTKAGWREVIIPESYQWIYKELRKLNPFGEYVFLKNGEVMKTDYIRKRMYRICKKLGIVPKSPHKARKTYGSILLDSNVDKKMIESQMGHADILCTEIHYHRNRKSHDTKQNIINNIQDLKLLSKSVV